MSTELAKAYVQIIPSARGMQANLEKELGAGMPAAGESAGHAYGSSLVSKLKGVISVAAIGKSLAATISAGGALEQSIGGVETLFGASADAVVKNAQQAYATVGMSANHYMEQATGFAASLNQSLGGDTVAAASAADKALRDMADNSNKMGTDMERITDAYQGFAKQNYTMLDNLKLGYGGTKSEMERLITDANAVKAANGEMADLSIDSFADVVEAIHTIQDEMNITGTTATEAATTLQGSAKAMKAAFKNVLGNLTLGEDIGPSLNALATTTKTFLIDNLAPAIFNILTALPGAVFTFINALIPDNVSGLVGNMVSAFSAFMSEQFPVILSSGVATILQFINGFLSGLPNFIDATGGMLNAFLNAVISAIPLVLSGGAQLLMSLVSGILQNLPNVISSATTIVSGFISTVARHLPELLAQGISLIGQLIAGLISMIPDVISSAGEIIETIINAFKEIDWGELGLNIIRGIVSGIKNAASSLYQSIKDLASNALQSAKDALGINSPSKVFARVVGRAIPEGTAMGIRKNSFLVDDAVREFATGSPMELETALKSGDYRATDRSVSHDSKIPPIIQNIYSEAKSAAELMEEARYQAELAVMIGV